MNEEIEYAEMLEIPVSTVSVTEKRKRFRKSKGDLKEKLISRVNKRAREDDCDDEDDREKETRASDAKNSEFAAGESGVFTAAKDSAENVARDGVEEGSFLNATEFFDVNTEKRDAYSEDGEENEAYYSSFSTVSIVDDQLKAEAFSRKKEGRLSARILATEFAAACVLCATIFMTNVFMPNSGLNSFFQSLFEKEEVTPTKMYSDFVLNGVVNDFAEIPLTVSETGVLSFRGKCCVYPAVDGVIEEVTENENGTYDIKISHSEDFYGMISGLNTVYYAAGDRVYANIPVGYTDGENDVQVTMYAEGSLLTSFEVDDKNGLAWVNT